MIFTSSKFIGVAAAAILALNSVQAANVFDKPAVATYWGQVNTNTYKIHTQQHFFFLTNIFLFIIELQGWIRHSKARFILLWR